MAHIRLQQIMKFEQVLFKRTESLVHGCIIGFWGRFGVWSPSSVSNDSRDLVAAYFTISYLFALRASGMTARGLHALAAHT